MKNKIIEAEGLTKIYKKSLKAVNDISFMVDDRENYSAFWDLTVPEKPPP